MIRRKKAPIEAALEDCVCGRSDEFARGIGFVAKMLDGSWFIPTAGSIAPLYFWPVRSACGEIDDGVSLSLGRTGGFVLSLSSLKRMVRLAEAARK